MSVLAYSIEQASSANSSEWSDHNYPRIFDYSGAIYISNYRTVSGVGTTLGVYQTADGITITPLDTGNAPSEVTFVAYAQYYKRSDSTVHFALEVTSGFNRQLQIITFDLDTGLFNAVITGGPFKNASTLFDLVVRSDGSYVIFYQSPSDFRFYYVIYDGIWGTPVVVSNAGAFSQRFVSIGINDTDDVILAWADENMSGDHAIKSRTLSALDVLTTTFTSIPSLGTAFGADDFAGNCKFVYVPSLDEFLYVYGDGATNFVKLLRLSPSADPDTVVTENICSNSNGEADFGIFIDINAANDTIYFADCSMSGASVVSGLQYRTQTVGSSSWSAPVVLFNGGTDALAPPYDGLPAGLTNPILGILSTGSIVIEAFNIINGVPEVQSREFFIGVLTTPIIIACPITNTGTQGVPFTATIIVSGGVPPYTFAITDGALPPGLTLNTSTGVISGTPTMGGTFTWTVTVTDVNMDTADVECSTTISVPTPVRPQKICVRQA